MIFLILFITIVLLVVTVITAYNFFTVPQILNEYKKNIENQLVSILIPARNEEENILRCLQSVSEQSYKNFEILVLDDRSEDKTVEIVNDFAEKDKIVRLIKGDKLPDGWLGKNWACHQLSQLAKGKYLLFIDSDITLSPHAVSNAVSLFDDNRLNMLSCFSTQKFNKSGEYLIVPLMNWLLLTFLPLYQVFISKRKQFAAANGQFLMFDRNSYSKIDGHNSVKNKIVEDMELARKVKSDGMNLMTTLGGDAVFCQMYSGFLSALKGFLKNFFPGFNYNLVLFAGFLLMVLSVFLFPIVLAIADIKYIWLIFFILFNRYFVSVMSRQNVLANVLLHPFQMLVLLLTGLVSVYFSITGKIIWKGRKINQK